MNENYVRWIKSSCLKHFADKYSGRIKLQVEGDDKTVSGHADYLEFRLDGPYFKELGAGYTEIYIEINMRDDDLYRHERNVGIATIPFTKGISVFKYGDGPDDNPLEQLFCLVSALGEREHIVISNFGVIKSDVRMMQSTVESHYKASFQVKD